MSKILDANGLRHLINWIKTSAITDLSVSGKTITYTKGDGSTGTITTQDTVYTLPTASSSTLGGVKVGTNLTISNGVLNAKDTTYSIATTSANGLMSATDKKKLDGFSDPVLLAVAITTSDWSNGTYTITDSRITEDMVIIDYQLGSSIDNLISDLSWETNDGTLTLTVTDTPQGTLVGTIILGVMIGQGVILDTSTIEELVENYKPFVVSGTIASGSTSLTIVDERITENTIMIKETFGASASMTSDAKWTTSAGQIVLTFSATSSETTLELVLQEGQ